MRTKICAATAAAMCALVTLPESAQANLALQLNPNASISSLSCQLLKKPRSQAGNQKNVWDADPPVAASSGFHYFVYNLDQNFDPLPSDGRAITLQGFKFGPGYDGTVEVLVADGPNVPFFLAPGPGQTTFNLTSFNEFGIARVSFNLVGAPGQIDEPDDEGEISYKGLDDDNNPNTPDIRGFEHVRFATEYRSATDTRDVFGLMTAIVPASFSQFSPNATGFAPGFLQFASLNQSYSGSQVGSAFVMSPEPASLASLAIAGTLLRRRRR